MCLLLDLFLKCFTDYWFLKNDQEEKRRDNTPELIGKTTTQKDIFADIG